MFEPRLHYLSFLICFLTSVSVARENDSTTLLGPLSPTLTTIPQNLLSLVHSEEVQEELGFTAEQLVAWEQTLREIDRVWWPARNLPLSKQRTTVAEQELRGVKALEKLLGTDAVTRLRQIELQSQSVRCLLRPEVGKFLKLDGAQTKKLGDLFAVTDRLEGKSLEDAKSNEAKSALSILNSSQSSLLQQLQGKPMDLSRLERIYPMAPELIDSGYWTGDEKVSLESLRGEVVLVHFYAFQCHNCVANFAHYKRWEAELKKKGVRVIGIQTPETVAERDPQKVISAASKEGFQFPVLIDVENKNWDAWGNTMWPTVYVVDKKGYIRFWWQGELNWKDANGDKKIESIVDRLLE